MRKPAAPEKRYHLAFCKELPVAYMRREAATPVIYKTQTTDPMVVIGTIVVANGTPEFGELNHLI